MTREQLRHGIKASLAKLDGMFDSKNAGYGDEQRGFYNFEEGAKLLHGESNYDTMAQTLLAWAGKHLVTVMKPGAIRTDPEFRSRCDDLALYFLILKEMRNDLDADHGQAGPPAIGGVIGWSVPVSPTEHYFKKLTTNMGGNE